MTEPTPTAPLGDDPTDPPGPPLDSALDRALGRAFGPSADSRASVLRSLEQRVSHPLGVHVDSQGLDDAPVKITEDSRKLRDPSGRYQVLGELGRGGVGIVYKGRDQDLGRDVAMKVLKDQFADNPEVLARFVEEAQIGGQLQHPGIVPVYELGLHAGERPYFAMKLVKGETLAARLAQRSDPGQDRPRLLGVFEQVCQTIAYAHARFVVHRDLKPANVMIGAFGEVQVVDWGFAKVLAKGGVHDERESLLAASERSVIQTLRTGPGSSGTHSVAGSMLGTPAYMPPEQALGDIERVDRQSDVFALGAILCEILTGEPPYREADGDVVRQAANGALDGAHARIRKSGAEVALQDLAIECLSRARAARPASAGELASRISAWLASVEERAHQAELRATEARMKQRTTLVTVAAGLCVMLLAGGAYLWSRHAAETRRARAMQVLDPAIAAATAALGKAQASVHDMALWGAARTGVDNAVALAQPGDVDPAVRGRVEELAAQIVRESERAQAVADALARDAAMVTRLEILRMPPDENVRDKDWPEREHQRLDRDYASAFAIYLGDVDLFGTDVEPVRSALQGAISGELAIALDHWGFVRDPSAPGGGSAETDKTARIRALAAMLDGGDAWRTELRSLLPSAARESERLRDLASRADYAHEPASVFRLLADALVRAASPAVAIDVLRRAEEVHPQDFDLAFRLALQLELLAEPDWPEALAAYRVARGLRPERNEVLHRIGIVLEKMNRDADALRIFKLLVARSPGDAHAAAHLGQSLLLTGDPQAALAVLDPTAGRDSMFVQCVLGDAYAKLGRFDEAIAVYTRLVETRGVTADLVHNFGYVLQGAGRFDEAIAAYRRALAMGITPKRTLLDLAACLQKGAHLAESIEPLEKVVAIDPQNGWALTALAHAEHAVGDDDAAIRTARLAIQADPANGANHLLLGMMLTRRGEFADARPVLERGIEVDGENAGIWINYGALLLSIGDPKAREVCERAVALAPNDADALTNLGSVLSRRGDTAGAIARFRAAALANPGHRPCRENLAQALIRQGQTGEAIAVLREVVALDPSIPASHAGLARALLAAGKTAEAEAEAARATELDPDDYRNFLVRSDLAAARGDDAQTFELLSRALQAAGDSGMKESDLAGLRREAAQRIGALGANHGRLGQLDEAEAAFRRAIALDPNFPEAHVDLSLALERTGRPKEALAEIEIAERLSAADDSPVAAMRTRRLAVSRKRVEVMLDYESILSGKRTAEDPSAWSIAVKSALTAGRLREIVAFTEATLRDHPELARSEAFGLYDPACAAALAAGSTAEPMDDAERRRLRGLARSWIGEVFERALAHDGGRASPARRRWMQHLATDVDFASVRGDALAKLPEEEAKDWREFWARVDAASQ
ncbi:MAG: tetratricopeptide repeat protein [Planctomycetota bacterium]